MNAVFRYRIVSELKLIIERWEGVFTLDEIIGSKVAELSDPEWNDKYSVLSDYRSSETGIEFGRNIDYSTYKESAGRLLNKHKAAILTEKPAQVVQSNFMKFNLPDDAPVEIEIFSTVEAALTWLGIDVAETERITRILKELNPAFEKT
ncbi:MAG: hypothetical protein ACOYXB_08315 [Bacteroidota bacterium]